MELYIIHIIAQWMFVFTFAYYGITNMQWYNYSPKRALFMHHKFRWHVLYGLIPIGVYIGIFFIDSILKLYALLVVNLIYLIAIIIWAFNLDKKLQFTTRVKKFFVILLLFMSVNELMCFFISIESALIDLLPLLFATITSQIYEKVLLNRFALLAKDKLDIMSRLIIICITASYGKTSIKNYLAQILGKKYSVYATPRSVNTHTGILADINNNLDYTKEIYIAEAGARMKGDIDAIASFLNPHYVVIGEIGEQHLEYFKNLQTIVETKFEVLNSTRLKKAFVYKNNPKPDSLDKSIESKITYFPENIRNVSATLEGTSFELKIKEQWHKFETSILGEFNVINLSVAIELALELKIQLEDIQKALLRLEPAPHRLNKIITNNKIILDDSFNGNLNGILESIRLASLYQGRKVIVTPGIVESTKEANIAVAKAIDKVFDIAIITGELNSKILRENIKNAQKIVVKEKSTMEAMLANITEQDDLVLFSNDAPSYI